MWYVKYYVIFDICANRQFNQVFICLKYIIDRLYSRAKGLWAWNVTHLIEWSATLFRDLCLRYDGCYNMRIKCERIPDKELLPRKRQCICQFRHRNRQAQDLYIMALPTLVFFFNLFLCSLSGLYTHSLTSILGGLFGSPFVGLKTLISFFMAHSSYRWRLTANTVLYN